VDVQAAIGLIHPLLEAGLAQLILDLVFDIGVGLGADFFHTKEIEAVRLADRLADLPGLEGKDCVADGFGDFVGTADGTEVAIFGGGGGVFGVGFDELDEIGAAANLVAEFFDFGLGFGLGEDLFAGGWALNEM